MRQPNDKKRPNTHSGWDDKIRAAKLNYIHVSKPLIQIPVWDAEGKDTGQRETVPVRKGRTYRVHG